MPSSAPAPSAAPVPAPVPAPSPSPVSSLASSPATPTSPEAFLAALGVPCPASRIHLDENPARLVEASVERHEGTLTCTGSLAVTTGTYTGRAPQNRFIVDTPGVHDRIA